MTRIEWPPASASDSFTPPALNFDALGGTPVAPLIPERPAATFLSPEMEQRAAHFAASNADSVVAVQQSSAGQVAKFRQALGYVDYDDGSVRAAAGLPSKSEAVAEAQAGVSEEKVAAKSITLFIGISEALESARQEKLKAKMAAEVKKLTEQLKTVQANLVSSPEDAAVKAQAAAIESELKALTTDQAQVAKAAATVKASRTNSLVAA